MRFNPHEITDTGTGPLQTLKPASEETAVGGFGTPSPAMAHIEHQSGVVRQRWDWINEQAQRAATQPWEVY
jgi:hypothetical protein